MKCYDELLFPDFISQFKKTSNGTIHIPWVYFDENKNSIKNSTCRFFVFHFLSSMIAKYHLHYRYSLDYNTSTIILKERVATMYCGYIYLDYAKREKYTNLVCKMNQIIPESGVLIHFVSNIPAHLESILYFECDKKYKQEIEQLAESFNRKVRYDKQFEDFQSEMYYRRYDSLSFIKATDQETTDLYMSHFAYLSDQQLALLHFDFSEDSFKPKIFISYSWNDKKIVRDFADLLMNEGMDIWIDYKAIDYGENILSSILQGLDEADLAIIFISKSYQKSQMAKKELLSLWNKVILKKTNWRIIKLDDVDPNHIYPTLGEYKYFDYTSENIEQLLHSIRSAMDQLHKQKREQFLSK